MSMKVFNADDRHCEKINYFQKLKLFSNNKKKSYTFA